MKLALVVPSFPRLSETFIVSKAVGLLDRGWDIHVVAFASDENAWRAFGSSHPVERLRTRTTVLPNPGGSRMQRLNAVGTALRLATRAPGPAARHLRATAAERDLRSIMRGLLEVPLAALKPTILHVEFGALAPGLLHLKQRLDCRMSVSFRGYDIAYAGLDDPGYYERTWETVDAAHFLGRDLWERARQRGAPEDLNRALIPPAIDVTQFPPRHPDVGSGTIGTSSRPARLLSVGRLHWKKGYEYALEAVAELGRRGLTVDYRIVGDGPYVEAVCFWRHQLGLDSQVTVLGAISPTEVAHELGQADIFLHAAISEGFGNAPLEAQARGVPVVCSDAEGLPENVAHEQTGIVVPRRDPHAMADAIERLIRNQALRSKYGGAGPSRVRRLFALPDQIAAWDRFYRDLAGNPD